MEPRLTFSSLRIYKCVKSIISDPDIGQKDPRWVGAWWLGFIICAGCSIFWALPMLLFPPKIPSDQEESPAAKKKRLLAENQSVLEKAKGIRGH